MKHKVDYLDRVCHIRLGVSLVDGAAGCRLDGLGHDHLLAGDQRVGGRRVEPQSAPGEPGARREGGRRPGNILRSRPGILRLLLVTHRVVEGAVVTRVVDGLHLGAEPRPELRDDVRVHVLEQRHPRNLDRDGGLRWRSGRISIFGSTRLIAAWHFCITSPLPLKFHHFLFIKFPLENDI